MQRFEYIRARTVEEAIEALSTAAGPARPLAGGTDLIAQLREGRRSVARVVDIGRIPDLGRIDIEDDGTLRLGAAVPCAAVYGNLAVRRRFPMLIDAVSMIGSVQIQSRASVGGNLCNAAPSADAIPPLICLEAEAVVAGPSGSRRVPVDEFCTAPGRTVLQENEILVELRVPAPHANDGGHYLRFIPRNEMDIAVAGSGARVRIDPKTRRVEWARIALASVAPTPLRVPAAEAALVGQVIGTAAVERAAALAAEASRPISDVRGSSDYRRHLVQVLTRRALLRACERAGVRVDDLGMGGVEHGR